MSYTLDVNLAKCHALTRRGTQCTKDPQADSEFCGQHAEKQPYGTVNLNGDDAPRSKNEEHDTQLLAEAQELLKGSPVPDGFKPEQRTIRHKKTKVEYEAHNGKRVAVPAVKFLQMQRGNEEWPRPPVSDDDIEAAVALLEQLHFLTCEICRRPIGRDGDRLFNTCLKAAKNSDMRLPRTPREAKRVRRSSRIITLPGTHAACIPGAEILARMIAEGDTSDDEALLERQKEAVDELWKRMQVKNPAATRLEAIDTMRAIYVAGTQKEVEVDG